MDAQALLSTFVDRVHANKWEDLQENDLKEFRALLIETPDLLQAKLVEEESNLSLKRWYLDTFGIALHQSSDPKMFHEALMSLQSCLQISDLEIQAVQLLDQIIRAGFDEHANKSVKNIKDTESQNWSEVLGSVETAINLGKQGSVTLNCTLCQLLQDVLCLLTKPKAKDLNISATQIAEKLQNFLKSLLAWVRPNKEQNQPSCLTLSALNCCVSLVLKRPGQAGRILPSILNLTSNVAKSRNFSAASIQKALGRGLISILKSNAQQIQAWLPKLREALNLLGIEASEIEKASKGDTRKGSIEKRISTTKVEEEKINEGPPQDPRLARNQPLQNGANENIAQRPLPDSSQLQSVQHIGRPDPVNNQEGNLAPLNQPHQLDGLNQIISVASNFLANKNQSGCLALANGLPPEVLADVVMALMTNLPRKEDIKDESSTNSSSKSGNALLAGLMQATQQSQGETSNRGETSKADMEQRNQQTNQQSLLSSTPKDAQNTEKRKSPEKQNLPPPPPPSPPRQPKAIKLMAVQFEPNQRKSTQNAALDRITNKDTMAIQNLRTDIMTHLIPQLQTINWSEKIMHEIEEKGFGESYELALKWLYSIFVTSTQPPPQNTESDQSMEVQSETEKPENSVQLSQQYIECLESLIAILRDKAPAKDRNLPKLLVDAPALPKAILVDCLSKLLQRGGEYSTLALISARDIIMNRPANRDEALQSILSMAVSEDSELRAKAVRLIANKLFPEIFLTSDIEHFALSELYKLKPLKTMSKPTQTPQLPDTGKIAENGVEKRPRENGPGGPSNAAVEESSEPQIKRAKVETNGVTRAASPPSEAPTSTSTTKGEFEHTPETAARFCELFCALCTKRHALLDDLFSTFGESKNVGRAAIMRNAEGLARVLGPQAPALLKLVASPPPGSMPLLLKMLNFLTESQHPPEVLVQACKQYNARSSDTAILAPILGGLPKHEVIIMLPKLLEPMALFNSAMHRIIMPGPSGEPKMSPVELLLALHNLDPNRDGVRLKQVMAVFDHCLTRRRDVFDKEVLTSVLQQLSQSPFLPPLYMRFLMQAQAAVPTLKNFVVDQLGVLVNKQIWANKSLFLGWNLAVRQNTPESFPIFLQLPPRVLSETLATSPAEFKTQLKSWSTSSACPPNQRQPILKLFDSIKSAT